MKKVFCILLAYLILIGCAQSVVISPSATPIILTPTQMPPKSPTPVATETPMPRKGVIISNQGDEFSSFSHHIPENLLAGEPGQARYEIDLIARDRLLKTCNYEESHTLTLEEQYVYVKIIDLETGQTAADNLFTNIEHADTTCPSKYAFGAGEKEDHKTIAYADDNEEEIQNFVNWLNKTMDELAQAPSPGS